MLLTVASVRGMRGGEIAEVPENGGTGSGGVHKWRQCKKGSGSPYRAVGLTQSGRRTAAPGSKCTRPQRKQLAHNGGAARGNAGIEVRVLRNIESTLQRYARETQSAKDARVGARAKSEEA